MNAHLVCTLALLDARVRLRRGSTLVTLLAVVALSWLMISDPAGGRALLVVGAGVRVRYTSSALALGSAAQVSLLLALAGFYLLRGRTAEDIRSGLGGVIGASAAGGKAFVVGRWCGGVVYLLALCGASMLTVLLCHAVRGEGPIEPLVYLQTYALVLVPMALFTAACATLFDGWAPLMGKRGDLLYFGLWVGQVAMLAAVTGSAAPGAIPVDFTGMSAVFAALSPYADVRHGMVLGMGEFAQGTAPLTLPSWLWSAPLVAQRSLAALLALTPLWLATRLFHRYSPDRVKPGRMRSRRSPLALVNGWLRPLARLVQPLFGLSARLPGLAGQALADVALTLAAAPAAIALLLAAQLLALAVDLRVLPGLVLACVAFWGVLVSELPTRDRDAACATLGDAVPGGGARRYWRQLAAIAMLGLMFTGVAALRLAAVAPVRGGAVVAGVIALSAFATLLGRASGSARLFLVLFLLGLYMGIQVNTVAMVDVIGFHGSATAASVLAWVAMGIAAAWSGHPTFNLHERK